MMIVTTKLPRRKLAFSAAAAALLCCAALVLSLLPAASQAVSAAAIPSPKGIQTNENRIEYLRAWGWLVQEEPLATEEILVPEEMDASYEDYLALQADQGFDLSKYAGKRAKRYTYEITNYPSGESGVQANLLIHRNTVIAGEILSPQMDGFLHGLAMPDG